MTVLAGKWTDDDHDLLREMWRERKTFEEMSVALGRTIDAISHRITRLGLREKTYPPGLPDGMSYENDPRAIFEDGRLLGPVRGDVTAAMMGDPSVSPVTAAPGHRESGAGLGGVHAPEVTDPLAEVALVTQQSSTEDEGSDLPTGRPHYDGAGLYFSD